MTPSRALEKLNEHAKTLGFDRLAVAEPNLPPIAAERFSEWIARGCHGEMAYLSRRLQEPVRPEDLLPGCRRVVVLAVNYFYPLPDATPPGFGRVAGYAGTRDYHKVLRKPLKRLAALIESELEGKARTFVDTEPLSERSYAVAAGMGFVGRNSMLIIPGLGSQVFLALLLTDLELPLTARTVDEHCGNCRRCVKACPTGAIQKDRSVDAQRCLSYLTIEHRGPIAAEFRTALGDRVFGCDTCQQICPLNQGAEATKLSDFCKRSFVGNHLDLAEILALDSEAAFVKYVGGTPVMRTRLAGLQRNACILVANTAQTALVPALRSLAARSPYALVRETAEWARRQLTVESPPGAP